MVPCAQMGCVVASLGGVAPHLTTVQAVARASVAQPLNLLQPQPQVAVVVTLAASLARLFSTKCLSIETMGDALVMVFTSIMLSLLLLGPLTGLAQRGMLILAKRSWLLFWVKPLMRLLVSTKANGHVCLFV